jgi:uncharacterized protein
LKSPCIDVCVIDPASGLCKGCLRTLDEIASWGEMTEAERERILGALKQRRSDSDVAKVSMPPLA